MASYGDGQRPIYSHKKGKALRYAEAWVDHYIEFGCDPDRKDLYLKHVADEGTIDKYDVEDGMVIDEDTKVINARKAADTFIRRYSIKEWVDEQKKLASCSYSTLAKDDYIKILNSIVINTKLNVSERLKAIQQVTKMMGCEGASKIDAMGGFTLNMDYKKED